MVKVKNFTYLNSSIISVWVHAPEIAKTAVPGQFVHIFPMPETSNSALVLRRPISICDINGEDLRFVMDIVGAGTREIARQIEITGELDILGPLGKGFGLDETQSHSEKEETVEGQTGKTLIIGGGIGVFPLLYLAKNLSNPTIILGFRSAAQVVMQNEFEAVGKTIIVTNDGSIGQKGLVTDAAREIITQGKPRKIYACGPKPMLKAVAELAETHGIPCEISMEERMACGIGACVGCVTPMVDGGYKCICKDGPVFNAKEVLL